MTANRRVWSECCLGDEHDPISVLATWRIMCFPVTPPPEPPKCSGRAHIKCSSSRCACIHLRREQHNCRVSAHLSFFSTELGDNAWWLVRVCAI